MARIVRYHKENTNYNFELLGSKSILLRGVTEEDLANCPKAGTSNHVSWKERII